MAHTPTSPSENTCLSQAGLLWYFSSMALQFRFIISHFGLHPCFHLLSPTSTTSGDPCLSCSVVRSHYLPSDPSGQLKLHFVFYGPALCINHISISALVNLDLQFPLMHLILWRIHGLAGGSELAIELMQYTIWIIFMFHRLRFLPHPLRYCCLW